MTDNDTPRPKKRRDVAVAIQGDGHNPSAPARVVASGHGAVARQIVELAFANGVKVREDADLAEVLALIDLHLRRNFPSLASVPHPEDETLHPVAQAALLVQEDLCVMSPVNGEWVLTAAAVCFPNRWDLTGKIGRSLMGIHQPVPHYAEKIGAATDSLFNKLSVDRPLWRLNWTIVDSPALHQPVPVPVPDALRLVNEHLADKLWFRRERQTLRKLPQSGDILFTIRTYVHSLAETLRRVPDFRAQLAASMTGLDAAMVDYKGWVGIREALGRWL